MRQSLGALQQALGNARSLRVGFLENASYPARENNAKRLTRGLDELERREFTGPIRPGQRFDRHRKRYDKNYRNFIGPRQVRRLTVAQTAFWNEFGTSRAPARPFFRNTIRTHSAEWGPALAGFLRDNGNQSDRALRLLGLLIRNDIMDAIERWPRDNAPLTVAIKGFNKGLIESARMQRSVDYEVGT
jgi:hypothetical protein